MTKGSEGAQPRAVWHVGVDGGGTSTLAVVARPDGQVIGWGRAGPANYHTVGAARAGQAVLRATAQAMRMAMRSAGLSPAERTRVLVTGGVALAGLDTESDRRRMAQELARLPVDRLHLFADGEAALQAAFRGRGGIVVLAGTGSVVMARDETGTTVRIGGWGRLLGDQGSAWAIGLKGLRAAVRAWEGWGRPTSLCRAACVHAGVATVGGLKDLPLESARWTARMANFAPAVLRCADDGDAVARDIVREAAAALAAMAAAARERLGGRVDDVALAGGLFRSERLRREMRSALRRACRGFRVQAAAGPPVFGALELGALADGRGPLPAFRTVPSLERHLKT